VRRAIGVKRRRQRKVKRSHVTIAAVATVPVTVAAAATRSVV